MDSSIWLQLETRVRVLIKDLIEPTVRRVSESMKAVETLSNYQQNLIYKVEDVESSISNIEKRLVVIDEFSTKIVEFEGNVHVMETRIRQDREELRSDLLTFVKNQEAFQENIEVLQKQREALKDDIAFTNNQVLNNKFELESKINQATNKFKDAVFAFNSKFLELDTAVEQINKNLKSLAVQVQTIDVNANDALRSTEENRNRIKKVNAKVDKVNLVLSREIDKVRNVGLTNTSDIMHCRKEIKRIDDLLSSDESAICNELNLTDPLYSVLADLPTLKLLASYEIKRLEKIIPNNHSIFVRDTISRLKAKAKEILDKPLPIVKKDSNISTKTKKKRRKERLKSFKKQMASSIAQTFANPGTNNPSRKASDANPDTLGFGGSGISWMKRKSKEFNTNDLTSQGEVKEKVQTHNENLETAKIQRKLSVVIHDAIVNNLSHQSESESNSDESSDDFIDFTPMIQGVKVQLQEEAEFMYNELSALISATSTSLSSRLTESNSYLSSLILSIKSKHEDYTSTMDKRMSELELHIQQAIFECNSASAQRKRDHVDYANQFKHVKSGFDEISQSQKDFNERLESFNKIIDSFIEFERIGVALQGQDEQDRESIFLMGSKLSKKNKVVSLDKRCLSCAGQSSSVISAFKVACLAYEPSQVLFQERKFTRKHLIRVQRKILERFERNSLVDISDEIKEVDKSVSNSNWRPLSVPVSRFNTLNSPHLRTPDVENLPFLRKSFNL